MRRHMLGLPYMSHNTTANESVLPKCFTNLASLLSTLRCHRKEDN